MSWVGKNERGSGERGRGGRGGSEVTEVETWRSLKRHRTTADVQGVSEEERGVSRGFLFISHNPVGGGGGVGPMGGGS